MKSWFLLPLFLLLASGAIHAQATLSIQGTIQKSFGGAVDDGKYSLTFKLYTAESGGTAVWSETQDGIEVIGGVYSALLGAANPPPAGFNTVYYLGISVDGGQELTPRTRLTSAPYALSLIGQSNTFPSAGAVGVGTASPASGNNLHVNNADGSAKVLITSADVGDATFLTLESGNNSGTIAIEGGNGNFNIVGEKAMNIVSSRVHINGDGGLKAYTHPEGMIFNGRIYNSFVSSLSGQELTIANGGDPHIVCRGDNWTEFRKTLYIPGARSEYLGGVNLLINTTNPLPQPTQNNTTTLSIRASYGIAAPYFFAMSDRRIKKDFQLSSGSDDLATLMKLEVTDYRHIDTIAKGSGVVKGFIAQQVKNVFPQAVTVDVDAIPDILSKPAALQVNGTEATLSMPAAHHLAVGDRVRIIKEDGQTEYEVLRVEGNVFTVKGWDAAITQAEKVFVYGKEVHDYHTVDYDKIHTLNVSATQELARRVAQLEAENAALRQKTGEVDGLRSELNDMKARFSKLEGLILSNANR